MNLNGGFAGNLDWNGCERIKADLFENISPPEDQEEGSSDSSDDDSNSSGDSKNSTESEDSSDESKDSSDETDDDDSGGADNGAEIIRWMRCPKANEAKMNEIHKKIR